MVQALAFYVFAAVTLLSALMVISARNPVHSVLFLILAFFSSAGLFILQGAEFLALLLVVVYVGAVAVLFLFVVMMLDIQVPQVKVWFVPKTKLFMHATALLVGYGVVFAGVGYLCLTAVAFAMSQVGVQIIDAQAFLMTPQTEVMRVFSVVPQLGLLGMVWLGLVLLVVWLFSRYVAAFVLKSNFSLVLSHFLDHAPLGAIIIGFLMVEMIFVIQAWGDLEIARENALQIIEPETLKPNANVLGQVLYTDYLYIFQTSGLILLVAMIGAIVLTHRQRQDVKRQSISAQLQRNKENELSLKKVEVGKGISGWD